MQATSFKPVRIAPSGKPPYITETYTAAILATDYVRLPVASGVCGVAKSTIWAWTAEGRFPKPLKLSPRVSPWPDVRAWPADAVARQAANKVGA